MAFRQDKKRESSFQLIYGIRAILEAIEAGKEIDKILVQNTNRSDLSRELHETAKQRNIPLQFVPVEKLGRVTRKNHQGAIAFISPIIYASIDHILDQAFSKGKVPFLVILDGITDVRNLGAIARSAHCAGADGLMIPARGQAPINADAIKTSAGALHHLPVIRVNNLAKSIRNLKNSGISIVGADEKATSFYFDADLSVPLGIIMGSEDTGIQQELQKLCDDIIRIPQEGKVASLNVSVAAGIILFEAYRQRGI